MALDRDARRAWVLFRRRADDRARSRSPSTSTARPACRAAARATSTGSRAGPSAPTGSPRGLPRILGVLDEFGARATFYVPGVTAERHPTRSRRWPRRARDRPPRPHASAARTSWTPRRSGARSPTGSAALEARDAAGRPRATARRAGSSTPLTLDVLWRARLRVRLEPDGRRPARTLIERPGRTLVELPVHWALDDAPHFAHTTDSSGLLATWLRRARAPRGARAGTRRHVPSRRSSAARTASTSCGGCSTRRRRRRSRA